MKRMKVAIVCKLMPLYRLGLFKALTMYNDSIVYTFFGDTKTQGGIETISWDYAQKATGKGIRWEKTNNYFYKSELLLWQTGIIWKILFSDFKVFIFEGAVSHYPVWLFALLTRLVKKKVLFWTHGLRGSDSGIKKIIRIVFFKYLANGLLLYGEFQKQLMILNGFSRDKLFVIYNSLNPEIQFTILNSIHQEKIFELKKRLFRCPSLFTIIFIGRLVSSKGVHEILRLCNSMKSNDIPINCIFIGNGSERSTLTKYCIENELEQHVYFAGALYEEREIAKLFALSDLMISPGNVGLNCIHSLTYGVPVFTHNAFEYQNPEVEAIIENKTGFFFEYEDFDDMLTRFKDILASNYDKTYFKNTCQKMIRNRYNPQNQANCISQSIIHVLCD